MKDFQLILIPHGQSIFGTVGLLADHAGQRLSLLPSGFDPETDEVIVAKKEAKRMWVSHGPTGQLIHISSPEWLPHISDWQTAHQTPVRPPLFLLDEGDCLEFSCVSVRSRAQPTESEMAVAMVQRLFEKPEIIDELTNRLQNEKAEDWDEPHYDDLLPPGCFRQTVSTPIPTLA